MSSKVKFGEQSHIGRFDPTTGPFSDLSRKKGTVQLNMGDMMKIMDKKSSSSAVTQKSDTSLLLTGSNTSSSTQKHGVFTSSNRFEFHKSDVEEGKLHGTKVKEGVENSGNYNQEIHPKTGGSRDETGRNTGRGACCTYPLHKPIINPLITLFPPFLRSAMQLSFDETKRMHLTVGLNMTSFDSVVKESIDHTSSCTAHPLDLPTELLDRMFDHQSEGVQWMYDLRAKYGGGILGMYAPTRILTHL